MKVSGHFNNCIMIIGWPIFRLERYFLGRKRNFLLHFARKSLHHHSIILVISDKHTHTGLMCRNTNHSRVTQTCRLSPLCYVHFSSIALVFVFSIVQNWTELVVIIPYLRGPSPFKKMEREWENEEEMEREWGNGERFTLYISSFSLYFLPLYPFPISKIVSFCRKMLNTALLSRMSQKTYHMCCEKIIPGRDCCEKAPQVVRAW